MRQLKVELIWTEEGGSPQIIKKIFRGKTGESTKFQVRAYNPYFCGMKIGSVNLPERPLILAPMEDVTDAPFRLLCKRFGVDLMFSEFVASEAVIRKIDKTLQKMEIHPLEHPYGIQLYGKDISAMVESTKIAEQYEPDLIDLNFGCPVKKIAMKGAGAGMLRDIPQLVKMTAEVVKASRLPVTVKTRLGWDENNIIIENLAEALQDCGIKALTIHGRTGVQAYKGVANWEPIARVKNNPRIQIPIIGNGDIDSPEKANEYFNRYGTDAIMIGRATVGKPWIFKTIKHYLATGELLPEPKIAERVEIAKFHYAKSLEWKNERGIFEIRRHFGRYFDYLPDFKELRYKLLTEENPEKVFALLDLILKTYGETEL